MHPDPDSSANTPTTADDGQGELFEPPPAASGPSFAGRGRRRRLANLGWWLSVPVLLLALGLLSLAAERDRLAGDPQWRPHVERACDLLGCRLPAWREPTAIRVLSRDVRPHPSAPDALLITATFRNDASWAQPWPGLRLALQDVEGREIAARDFLAADYLGSPPANPLLASGQSANITLEVLDPDHRAVAFSFDFH